jgi:hypothetical protein
MLHMTLFHGESCQMVSLLQSHFSSSVQCSIVYSPFLRCQVNCVLFFIFFVSSTHIQNTTLNPLSPSLLSPSLLSPSLLSPSLLSPSLLSPYILSLIPHYFDLESSQSLIPNEYLSPPPIRLGRPQFRHPNRRSPSKAYQTRHPRNQYVSIMPLACSPLIKIPAKPAIRSGNPYRDG